MANSSEKKNVIAYLHTHWDREWYREYEVFRLRLLRVFDNILNMLKNDIIPSFYFDGQVAALLDYLEFRPNNEQLIRELVVDKKLYIGPFYTLIDEFLTDGTCFRKNLEIGLNVARYFGCVDFIGYFADTFGHSQNVSKILQEYDIDKAIVWRGVGDLPADFIFNGVNTVNLVRGYFMDIFACNKPMEEKASFLKDNLDKIAEKSGDYLLLPIGADHLGVPFDIAEQIQEINNYLDDYEIILSDPFEYFENVKFKVKYSGELRDNSKTFILPGAYSARLKLKQMNTLCSYKLSLADKIQFNFGGDYTMAIDYAYRLLLQNQAHDSICGCSTDDVHSENIIRYNKILQIANTIIEECKFAQEENMVASFKYQDKYKILELESTLPLPENSQVIDTYHGFPSKILYDTLKVPVTEDYTTIYKILREYKDDGSPSDLNVENSMLENSNIKLEVKDGMINLICEKSVYRNFIEFVRYKDEGDTYNYAPNLDDTGEVAQIRSSHVIMNGPLRCAIKVDTSFFGVVIYLNKKSKLLNFKISWSNLLTNKLWQVRFNLDRPIRETQSEDLNELIKRKFNPTYNLRENLPNEKGLEAKTNTAPMQRFVWANGFGVITKGLTEYEVHENTLSITLLRSIGIISNPKNPARTTPAGPPIRVSGAQQQGANTAEFSIGFFDVKEWDEYVEEIYPETVIF